MSVESVRAFFATHAPEIKIIELADSTATVELAAKRVQQACADANRIRRGRSGDDDLGSGHVVAAAFGRARRRLVE